MTKPRYSCPRTRRLMAWAAAIVGLLAARGQAAEPLPTVPHVDLGRYAGKWHEVARLPNFFQRKCERSQTCYSARGDGSLTVVNTCSTSRGADKRIEGRAEPVPGSGNARLRVRFSGLAALAPVQRDGNYWIIALDDDYQWAMVGTPDRKFLWILAREPRLPPDIYCMLTDRARCLGFDVSQLVR